MARYSLGFYGFGELTVSAASGLDGIGLATTPAEDVGSLDGRIALAGPTPVLTPLLAEEIGPRAQIAADSPFGVQGQAVDLDYRLTLTTDDLSAHELVFDVLCVVGTRVGLLGTRPLQPGVTYRITNATEVDALAAMRSFAGQGAADATVWDAIFCFTFGTRIDTPDGARLIEVLRPGDLVTTLGNGSQRLRWTGSRHVPVAEMLQVQGLQPVEFAAGAIGNTRPLRVSPQHRILLNDWRAQVFFGEDEVLIPAKAMVNGTTIRQVLPAEGVTYVHLLFDRHEILVSEGALSESFHPGEPGLLSLDAAQRQELELLFPGLELLRRRAAFPIVKLSEARALRLPD